MTDIESPSFDIEAQTRGRRLPTAANIPGTTLGLIRVPAFSSGGDLVDTPGLHIPHRALHTNAPGAAQLVSRQQLKGQTFVLDDSLERHSFSWAGGLVQLSINQDDPTVDSLTFFGPEHLKALDGGSAELVDEPNPTFKTHTFRKEIKSSRTAAGKKPTRQRSAAPLGDIAISGIPGWIRLIGHPPAMVDITIRLPVGVEFFWRPPVPTIY